MKIKLISISTLLLIFSFGYSQNKDNFTKREAIIDSIMNSYLIHGGKHPVLKNYQFKIASITKTFVATIVLQSVEENRLDIHNKASEYLSDIDYLKFDEFHVYYGEVYSHEITIEYLLRHTSGIGDIFTDKEIRFLLSIFIHKKRMYNEPKVVQRYFKYRLNKQPKNRPGEGYHYSDMNYMLSGFIIRKVTRKTLARNIRERIVEPLNMKNTYFEYYEP